MKILDEQKELSDSIITTSLKADTGTKKDKDIYLEESVKYPCRLYRLFKRL